MSTVQHLRHLGLFAILSISAACGATGAVASNPPAMVPSPVAPTCRIFVMWPASAPSAFRGNVVVHPADVESIVAYRILEEVRKQCPAGELVHAAPARECAADYLLVPTIEQWNQNRTDDPIGALITPRNRIAISLRLVRLHNPGVVGRVSFTNRSRITLNQSASRLLDDDFDAAVRALLGDQAARRQ